MKSNYDKILAASPVDATAARVTSKGEAFDSKKRITQAHSETPLPIRPFKRQPGNVEALDLTGTRFGRFTVLGISADGKKDGNGTLWVVRCACGRYSTRRTRSIKNPANAEDRCEECRQLAFLQRDQTRRQFWKEPA